jgi:cysteinyl-tRNA synthetase
MSKSLNNFFLVKDVLEKYSGDALRYFLLSTHYRSPLDFSDDRLEEAEKNMDKLKDVIGRVKELSGREGSEVTEASKALEKAAEDDMKVFHEAMDDDFNTGLATGAMFELAKAINVYYNDVHSGIGFNKASLEKAGKAFKAILDILGILEKEWKKTEYTSPPST